LGLSNEILCILVAQEVAKLLEVKFEGPKKRKNVEEQTIILGKRGSIPFLFQTSKFKFFNFSVP